MISEHKFLKASKPLNLPDELVKSFYRATAELFSEYYKEEKDKDWKNIFAAVDRQWPFLDKISDRTLPIYADTEEGSVTLFVNSICDERKMRVDIVKFRSEDVRSYLQILIRDRVKLFEKMLDVDQEDIAGFKKGSSWVKWLIAGGVATIVTVGVMKGVAHQKDNKKEKQ